MRDDEWRKYSASEIKEQLVKLKNWKVERGKLHRELEFPSFEDALAFMVRASLDIAKIDHHPEWFNVYNRITIDLVTHDLGGISGYDFILARKLDELTKAFRAK
ncbi:MAG TPA: 4a-hydroxytetrahydrobiopterin dehydratase [Nitrososphaerales archaeon]|nr:4a-hydroxytetrahydrobiopterin dehydratase [Nitrososphaerales archaeon]